MQFPIDITFKLLAWRADLHLTDATGQMIGYVAASHIREGSLPVYADLSMGPPIYKIRAEHGFTQWFEDGAGTKIGEFGLTPLGLGKYIIIEGRPQFRFAIESEWLDFFDSLVPRAPVLSGLFGSFVRPRTNAIRIASGPDQQGETTDGANVLRITKKRMLIDIRYTLVALEEVASRERECLILSAIVYALQDHSFRTMR